METYSTTRPETPRTWLADAIGLSRKCFTEKEKPAMVQADEDVLSDDALIAHIIPDHTQNLWQYPTHTVLIF